MTSLARATFNQQLHGRELRLGDAQAHSDTLRRAAAAADLDGDGVVTGVETDQLFLEIDKLDRDGSFHSIRAATDQGPTEAGALATAAVSLSVVSARTHVPVTTGGWPFTPPAGTLDAARRSGAGRQVLDRAPLYRDIYVEAARLTGVPAAMILALHANESAVGSNRASTHGPESGFGLDDRWVTKSWANGKLAAHGLGAWERGTDTPKSRLQSAVVAAEHLKRQAKLVGVTVSAQMSTADIAGAITSYVAGTQAAKRAKANKRSFMFDLGDSNPHVLHPGGTSRTRRGTVRVPASRKPGLLRWDTLLVLADEALKAPPPPVS